VSSSTSVPAATPVSTAAPVTTTSVPIAAPAVVPVVAPTVAAPSLLSRMQSAIKRPMRQHTAASQQQQYEHQKYQNNASKQVPTYAASTSAPVPSSGQ